MSNTFNYLYDCSCNGGIIYNSIQCKGCGGNNNQSQCQYCDNNGTATVITQKRIWNTVRVSESEYASNLVALNVYTPPLPQYGFVNWNQYSDRALPSGLRLSSNNIVPSRGNSTKSSLTRQRPGACAPGGIGVDVKHGSYARYLARLKGRGPAKTQISNPLIIPVKGNKTQYYGIANSSTCLCFV
jgi:hypothetical protein